MLKYAAQTRILVAVDCIIFGFDEEGIKLLLVQRGFAPKLKKWSLMGGFVKKKESLEEAANRILKKLTGLDNVFMDQIRVFSEPGRDPVERTISVAYMALIDIRQYEEQLSEKFRARWFCLNELPDLFFDHEEMVEMAKSRLRYQAALHPLLFELLPQKFTLSQLKALYEGLYEKDLDGRNFIRKVLSSGILVKSNEKDKENSRKGAFLFTIDKKKYKRGFQTFLKLVPQNNLK
jgi:8-oxo-dGTP diphosphatase